MTQKNFSLNNQKLFCDLFWFFVKGLPTVTSPRHLLLNIVHISTSCLGSQEKARRNTKHQVHWALIKLTLQTGGLYVFIHLFILICKICLIRFSASPDIENALLYFKLLIITFRVNQNKTRTKIPSYLVHYLSWMTVLLFSCDLLSFIIPASCTIPCKCMSSFMNFPPHIVSEHTSGCLKYLSESDP